MNDESQKALMAFMAGELQGLEAERMAQRLEREAALAEAWERQHRVSFLLQQGRSGQRPAPADFAARVRAAIALETEEGALESRRRPANGPWFKASAAAAVVVLAVSLLSFLPGRGHVPTSQMASSSRGASATQAVAMDNGGKTVFALRPVRFVTTVEPDSRADLLIQRDIRRIWVPSGRAFPNPALSYAGYDPASFGGRLLPTRYERGAGIASPDLWAPAGQP
ncbi:MAG: sigma-E factor negative regulatory protein [Acidithiobacillus sp.]|uniref:sigma-E factor negative regulatory protein n=1 Tax=Acidithiobacillus sp. TaxID=1872118 RepID=UPI002274615D|nr:sigma-E factor negative regulatory protein [Acidithiobacillus sp.]MCE5420440.1 sigma-E factor negative regulatory protein [Acidithiobacillus sp.]MCY0872385.1 sigma-E factor negative regulatory protein [Acidithiobacillus caldus]